MTIVEQRMLEPNLITVADAIAIIDSATVAPRVGRVKLADAQGLRLAHDVLADRDYPPFDKSLMDGYAVRCADVATAPVELVVIGEIAAGQQAAASLGAGQTFAIMTGAPLPDGADGVVPVEDTVVVDPTASGNEARVRIVHADNPSRFIAHRSADCAAGAVVLTRGTKLESAQLAVAASVGAAEVDVFAPPRVAVLTTGDELVNVDQVPGPSQIRNSSNIMLTALLERLGCEVTDLGTARDDPQTIRGAIENGLQFDSLLITGGMSMGRYDFVPGILKNLGVELKITKLRIKPGKPFVFGVLGGGHGGTEARGHEGETEPDSRDKFIFGLPGNPVSSFVCALRLCSRLLLRMGGAERIERIVPGQLAAPLEPNGSREFYQPAIIDRGMVTPLKWKGSADIYTLATANGLIIRAENAPALPAGAKVDLLEIPS